jgi:hypothetical protein
MSWRNLGDLSILGEVGSSVAIGTHSDQGEIYGGMALRVFRAGPSKTL